MKNYCGAVAVSFYSRLNDSYKESNENTIEAIDLLIAAGCKVNVHYVLSEETIDEAKYDDVIVPHGVPSIIDNELFDRVQFRMAMNQRAPSRSKAEEEYLLTTKLFCGDCGRLMAGESGTSGTKGTVHHYYKCGGAKRRLGCKRKAIKKWWMERLAVLLTVNKVLHDREIERMADAIVALQAKEDTALPAMRRQLQECEKAIENMLKAIQQGILTTSTKNRLEELEKQKEDLEINILQAQLQRPRYSKEQVISWVSRFKYGNIDDPDYQRQIIDIFINAIYVYDDKLVFTYNFQDGTETISLKEIEETFGSDLARVPPPFCPEGRTFGAIFDCLENAGYKKGMFCKKHALFKHAPNPTPAFRLKPFHT